VVPSPAAKRKTNKQTKTKTKKPHTYSKVEKSVHLLNSNLCLFLSHFCLEDPLRAALTPVLSGSVVCACVCVALWGIFSRLRQGAMGQCHHTDLSPFPPTPACARLRLPLLVRLPSCKTFLWPLSTPWPRSRHTMPGSPGWGLYHIRFG
jgi:hypothetical protein